MEVLENMYSSPAANTYHNLSLQEFEERYLDGDILHPIVMDHKIYFGWPNWKRGYVVDVESGKPIVHDNLEELNDYLGELDIKRMLHLEKLEEYANT